VEGDRDAEAGLTRRASLLALLVLVAGCGGSPSPRHEVAASCKRQQAALAAIGRVESLPQAKRALHRTIDVERRALDDLRRARSLAGVPALARRYEVARADARRFLGSLENVDPTQSMTPLQVGPAGARRAVGIASGLAAVTCAL